MAVDVGAEDSDFISNGSSASRHQSSMNEIRGIFGRDTSRAYEPETSYEDPRLPPYPYCTLLAFTFISFPLNAADCSVGITLLIEKWLIPIGG